MKLTAQPTAVVSQNNSANNDTLSDNSFMNFVSGECIAKIQDQEYLLNITVTGQEPANESRNFPGATIASASLFMEEDLAGEILTAAKNNGRIWTAQINDSTKFITLTWYFTIQQQDNLATGRFEVNFPVSKPIYQLYLRENNLEAIFLSADKTTINPDITNRKFLIGKYDGR